MQKLNPITNCGGMGLKGSRRPIREGLGLDDPEWLM